MKLILTRHGETLENIEGIAQGHLPGTLSPKGIRQAKRLAFRLKNEKLDAVYSSDLRRARDTTKEIAKFHSKTPVHFVKSLRETDLGKLTGKKIDWKKGRPKEIESRESMMKRVKKVLDKAFKAHPNGTVVFVGHIGINKALTRVILNQPASSKKKIPIQSNASVSVFKIREDKNHKVKLLNCSSHLD